MDFELISQLLALLYGMATNCSLHTGTRSYSKAHRQLLRPWLEEQLDRGTCPGLKWLNGKRDKFVITWKHLGKPGWREEDCVIFKAWAKHTGRFVEGRDEPNWSCWKLRLRNAFNRAKDIVEDDSLSQPHATEPYKVYRLIPRRRAFSLPQDLADIRKEDLVQGTLPDSIIKNYEVDLDLGYMST